MRDFSKSQLQHFNISACICVYLRLISLFLKETQIHADNATEQYIQQSNRLCGDPGRCNRIWHLCTKDRYIYLDFFYLVLWDMVHPNCTKALLARTERYEIKKYPKEKWILTNQLNYQTIEHQPDVMLFYSLVRDHEVLFILFQIAASTGSPLPGPDVQDAWPPVE